MGTYSSSDIEKMLSDAGVTAPTESINTADASGGNKTSGYTTADIEKMLLDAGVTAAAEPTATTATTTTAAEPTTQTSNYLKAYDANNVSQLTASEAQQSTAQGLTADEVNAAREAVAARSRSSANAMAQLSGAESTQGLTVDEVNAAREAVAARSSNAAATTSTPSISTAQTTESAESSAMRERVNALIDNSQTNSQTNTEEGTEAITEVVELNLAEQLEAAQAAEQEAITAVANINYRTSTEDAQAAMTAYSEAIAATKAAENAIAEQEQLEKTTYNEQLAAAEAAEQKAAEAVANINYLTSAEDAQAAIDAYSDALANYNTVKKQNTGWLNMAADFFTQGAKDSTNSIVQSLAGAGNAVASRLLTTPEEELLINGTLPSTALLGEKTEEANEANAQTAANIEETAQNFILNQANLSSEANTELAEKYADYDSLLATGVQLASSGVGSMVPNMVASAINPALGYAAIAGQGYGSGYSEALQNDATTEQAETAAALNAGVSLATETLFDGFAGVNLPNGGTLDSLLDAATKKAIKSEVGQSIANALGKALGEGFEEVAESAGSDVANKIAYGADTGIEQVLSGEMTAQELASEVGTDFAGGFLAAGVANASSGAANAARQQVATAQAEAEAAQAEAAAAEALAEAEAAAEAKAEAAAQIEAEAQAQTEIDTEWKERLQAYQKAQKQSTATAEAEATQDTVLQPTTTPLEDQDANLTMLAATMGMEYDELNQILRGTENAVENDILQLNADTAGEISPTDRTRAYQRESIAQDRANRENAAQWNQDPNLRSLEQNAPVQTETESEVDSWQEEQLRGEIREENNNLQSLEENAPPARPWEARREAQEQADAAAYDAEVEAQQQQSNRTTSAPAVKKLASRLRSERGSKYNVATLENQISDLYNEIATGSVSQSQLVEEAVEISRDVLEQSVEKGETLREENAEYDELYKRLSTVEVTPAEYNSIVAAYGATRGGRIGGVQLRQKSGQYSGLDVLNSELSSDYGEFFNADMTSADEIFGAIVETRQKLNQRVEGNPYAGEIDEAAYDMANDILQSYWNMPESRTKEQSAVRRAEQKQLAEREVAARKLEAVKQKNAERIAEMRESQTKARERRISTEYDEAAQKNWNKLYQMMTKPTVDSHIPNVGGLREATKDILEMINPGTNRTGRDGVLTQSSQAYRDKINRLENVLQQSGIDSASETLSTEQYKGVMKDIAMLKDIFAESDFSQAKPYEGTGVQGLSNAEKRVVLDVVTGVIHKIDTANKLISYAKNTEARQMRQQAISEVRNSGGLEVGTAAGTAGTFLNNYLSVKRLFNRIGGYAHGGAWESMYDSLNGAAIDTATQKLEGMSYFNELASDKEGLKNFTGKNAEKITLSTHSGKASTYGSKIDVEVTPAILANMIDVWVHNPEQVERSGFTIPNLTLYYQGKTADAMAAGTEIIPTDTDLENWSAMVDSMGVGWMQAMTDYSKGTVDKKRATQETVDGFTNFFNDDHRTIYRNTDFVQTDSEATTDTALRRFGFTNYRKQTAVQPIQALDITDYAAKTVNDDATYIGMTNATNDFYKIYDRADYISGAKKGDRPIPTKSVKGEIREVWGTKTEGYIENMMHDLKGEPRSGNKGLFDVAADKLISNVAGAALSMNMISTPLKQSPSAFAAASVFGMDVVNKGFALEVAGLGKENKGGKYAQAVKNINEASPLLEMRSVEGGSQELATLKGKGGISDFTASLPGSKAITWVDAKTVQSLQIMSAIYTEQQHPELDINSKEFAALAADKFNEAVQDTQPNYSVLQRSEMQRSGSVVNKVLGQFKTQPVQNANLIIDAVLDYQANKDTEYAAETKQKLVQTMQGQVASMTMFIIMEQVARGVMHQWDYWRDEDGNITAEAFFQALGTSAISYVAGMVPLAGELVDLMSGYDYSSPIADGINNIYNGVSSISSGIAKAADLVVNEASEETWDSAIEEVLEGSIDLMDTFGIPASSTQRLYKAAVKWGQDFVNQELDVAGNREAYTTNTYQTLFEEREALQMNATQMKLWYQAYTGVNDGDGSYYQNRVDDESAAEVDEFTELMLEAFIVGYQAQGYTEKEASSAANAILPSTTVTDTVSVDGTTYELDAEQIVELAEIKADVSYDLLKALLPQYAEEIDEMVLANAAILAQDYADDVAKATVTGTELSGSSAVLNDLLESSENTGMDAAETLLWYQAYTGVNDTSYKDADTVGNYYQNRVDDEDAAQVDVYTEEFYMKLFGYYQEEGYSDADASSKASSVLPSSSLTTSVTVDGKTYDIEPEGVVKMAEMKADTSYEITKDIFEDYADTMDTLTMEEALTTAQDYATATAKSTITGESPSAWVISAQEMAQDPAYDLTTAIVVKAYVDMTTSEKDANGNTITGSRQAAGVATLMEVFGWDEEVATMYYKMFA